MLLQFYVSMDTFSSKASEANCGVSQGSVVGPLLFNVFMLPLGDVTQLYIAVTPDDEESVIIFLNCILDLKSGTVRNSFWLNQDQTEVLDDHSHGTGLLLLWDIPSLGACLDPWGHPL